jgi:uncharacterized C2H2 Zn-finger protein
MSKEKYWEILRKDWFQKTSLVTYLITIFLIISLFSIFLFPNYWHIWTLIIMVEIILFTTWQAKNSVYSCPRCGKIFEISTIEYFLCPSGVNSKYLKCPECGKGAWTEILRIKDHPENKKHPENEKHPEN